MSNTTNNNFPLIPSGTVEWNALWNDVMAKIEGGRTLKLTAGAALAIRDPFYVAADGKAYKSTNATPCHGLWRSTSTEIDAEGYGQIDGTMTYASWTWTPGNKLYATAAGALTTTSTPYLIAIAISATQVRIVANGESSTGLIIPHATMATGGTLTVGDSGKLIIVDSGSDQVLNLPAVTIDNIGVNFKVVKLGSGKLTLSVDTGDYIEDSSASGTMYCSDTGIAILNVVLVSATKWITYGSNIWTTT